jgi:phenylpyruvate tautomerase PptA (4-oxalocrotonate tautomerase family)
MPTYTVNYSGLELGPDQKDRIAQSITKTHNAVTGANSYFAQVIYYEIPHGDHFIGGKPVAEPQLFLHGQIRAGRTAEIIQKLILDLRDVLTSVSGLDKSQIWIYLDDLLPSQMIEYGEILPRSGDEPEWFAGLSPRLRKKLAETGE